MALFNVKKGEFLKITIAVALGGYSAIMLVLLTFFGFVTFIDWFNGVNMWWD